MTHLSAQSISSQTEDWALLKNLRGYMPKSSDTFLHPQLANTNRTKFHLPLNQDTETLMGQDLHDRLVTRSTERSCSETSTKPAAAC